jgi:hypothetical protein
MVLFVSLVPFNIGRTGFAEVGRKSFGPMPFEIKPSGPVCYGNFLLQPMRTRAIKSNLTEISRTKFLDRRLAI